jgi:hypothetical protein
MHPIAPVVWFLVVAGPFPGKQPFRDYSWFTRADAFAQRGGLLPQDQNQARPRIPGFSGFGLTADLVDGA